VRLYLAAWDGTRWRSDTPLEDGAFREGKAVPFLLRIDRVRPGDVLVPAVFYDCHGFASLTSFDADDGSAAALAEGGPRSPVPDAAVVVPGDGGGSVSLWGGLFAAAPALSPPGPCAGSKSLELQVRAVAGTLYLMWGAEIAAGAASGDIPLALLVALPGPSEPFQVPFEINPSAVTAGP
jgi:hypothetical protein